MTSLATAYGVDEGYRHVAKHARPASCIGLGDAVLKWYDIARADDPVPPTSPSPFTSPLRKAGAHSSRRTVRSKLQLLDKPSGSLTVRWTAHSFTASG